MSKAYRPKISDPILRAKIDKSSQANNRNFWELKEIFANDGENNKYAASLADLVQNKLFRAATHLLRFYSAEFEKLQRAMGLAFEEYGKNGTIEQLLDGKPFMIPGKKPEEIIVFTYLPLARPNKENVANASWATHRELLVKFHESLQSALEDEQKSKGWSPFKTGLHRLWRTETLAIEKAITRYTNAVNIGYTPAQIRDASIAYMEAFVPNKVEFCTKPEEYLELYSKGGFGSCQDVAAHPGAWNMLAARGLCPMSFYGYSPYAKAAYIKSRGKIVARTICLQNEDDSWVFGRIYESSIKYRMQLVNCLAELGIKPLKGGKVEGERPLRGIDWNRNYTFEIPGVPTEGLQDFPHAGKNVYMMPIGFLDNHSRNVFVRFDAARKVFIVEVDGPHTPNVSGQTNVGYALSNQLESIDCDACGKHVLANKAVFSNDGMNFCSVNCAGARGYVNAQRNDGTMIVTNKADCLEDAYAPGHFYTNREAAIAMGAMPYLGNVTDRPEDGNELLTAHAGNIVQIDTDFFRVTNDEYKRLSEMGAIKKDGYHPKYGSCMRLDKIKINGGAGQEIDIKQQRVVLIDEDFVPFDQREIERLRALL